MNIRERLERKLSGHISIGRFTIYGRNAMHWGVNVWTRRWGYICFRLPFTCFGRWWPLYFYLSPNATPWASTLHLNHRGFSRRAEQRRRLFGHGFDAEARWQELREFNDSYWDGVDA